LVGCANLTLLWSFLPDSKKYTVAPNAALGIFNIQTQWIVNQRSAQNIVFVSHLGDLVDDWNVADQWDIADAGMDLLDSPGIPYGIGIGNSDMDYYGLPLPQASLATTCSNTYFPATRFLGSSYLAGHITATMPTVISSLAPAGWISF
jgi:hypothetical protein